MITFKHKGNFNHIENFMTKAPKINVRHLLEMYGRQGVIDLASATPKDTGLTADSWNYEIKQTRSGYSLIWTNSNLAAGVPIVILLQYGHGTSGGTYVEGRDFINPAIKPIVQNIADNIWKEVSKL